MHVQCIDLEHGQRGSSDQIEESGHGFRQPHNQTSTVPRQVLCRQLPMTAIQAEGAMIQVTWFDVISRVRRTINTSYSNVLAMKWQQWQSVARGVAIETDQQGARREGALASTVSARATLMLQHSCETCVVCCVPSHYSGASGTYGLYDLVPSPPVCNALSLHYDIG